MERNFSIQIYYTTFNVHQTQSLKQLTSWNIKQIMS